MYRTTQSKAWSLKRSVFLPVLMRLDEFRPVGRVFRLVYRALARIIAWNLRHTDVRNIYLRRGIAKCEFMPFLSDIDMLVITGTDSGKKCVEKKLKRIRSLVPMLEPQSPVITIAEFNAWTKQTCFAENRSFLYRVLEARETWESLYSRDNDNPLERMREFESNEIKTVIFSEILFWHRIVVSEYSSYRLGNCGQYGYVQRKRFCWIFMKATTELYNFLQALRHRCMPQYTRREIIRSAIGELDDRRWADLFRNNLMIIDNQFDSSKSDSYLDESMSFLSYVYGELHALMKDMIDDTEFSCWLIENCRTPEVINASAYHAVDLDNLPGLRLPGYSNVVAVYIASQQQTNREHRVLVVLVLKSLKVESLESIDRVMDPVVQILASRDIRRDQIEVDLVDQYGFGCFGVIRNTGPKGIKPMTEITPCFLPTLFHRIFIAASTKENIQAVTV